MQQEKSPSKYQNGFNLIKLIDDPQVFGMFVDQQELSAIHFRNDELTSFIAEYKPENIMDLALAYVLFFKPGQFSSKQKRIMEHRKNKTSGPRFTLFEPILCETYGEIVFMEQVTAMIRILSNFTFEEADELMHDIVRQSPNENLIRFKDETLQNDQFIEACKNMNFIPEKSVNLIIDWFKQETTHIYNLHHSVVNSCDGYFFMWTFKKLPTL